MGMLGSNKSSPGYSVIHDRLTIRGELDTDGTVRVEGRVEGPVHRVGTLIVGAGGFVVGDVEAKDVTVAGQIQGNVHASGRLEIEPGASVLGEVRANLMILREGATIHGQVSIGATPPAAVSAPTGSARRLEIANAPSALPAVTGRR
ncbi:MAG TPA: polymer-forming cytoskeletal protein [Gemmatimonadaceae bacterium]|nr:polymer-forming cytoskeletal protein [Gemmatimonadaceae bacterium]